MGKIIDRLLLFLFSLALTIGSITVTLYAFGLTGDIFAWFAWDELGHSVRNTTILVLITMAFLIVSLRLLYVSLRSGDANPPTIDQRTSLGDVQISLETVENLTLKAASRQKGLRDLKARVNVNDAGLELTIRAVVNGDESIPDLSETTQRAVKEHVEEITGIPVAVVSVYIANVSTTQSFRSRVE